MNLVGLPTALLQARIEYGYGKSKLAKIVPVEVLTPASPSDLPPLGELIVDDLFWRYPAGLARRRRALARLDDRCCSCGLTWPS